MQRIEANAITQTASAALASLLALAAILTAPHTLWALVSWSGLV